jgi:hypothetical protein
MRAFVHHDSYTGIPVLHLRRSYFETTLAEGSAVRM